MKYGDIFLTEYGDFDNWVEMCFEGCERDVQSDCTKIKFHLVGGTVSDYCYHCSPIEKVKFKVIGREEREDNNNE